MVERRSPKLEVGGSSPSAPARLNKIMRNPIKFLQEVKQEAFKVTWPTGKETLQGTSHGGCYGNYSIYIFLLLDQLFQFILGIILKIDLMKNWYIVQSHSSFENKVAQLIKEEADKAKISDKIEEIVVPTHDVTEVKRGKRVQRKKNIFLDMC